MGSAAVTAAATLLLLAILALIVWHYWADFEAMIQTWRSALP